MQHQQQHAQQQQAPALWPGSNVQQASAARHMGASGWQGAGQLASGGWQAGGQMGGGAQGVPPAQLACAACGSAPRAATFAPCGHRALCYACTQAFFSSAARAGFLLHCPLCFTPVGVGCGAWEDTGCSLLGSIWAKGCERMRLWMCCSELRVGDPGVGSPALFIPTLT